MATLNHVWLLGFIAVGCGDPQLDQEFRGTPIWQYKGEIQSGEPVLQGSPNVRAALFFSPSDPSFLDLSQAVEHLGAALPVAVPSTFTLNVFEPPASEHLLRTAANPNPEYAVGRLLVYMDA